MTVGDLKKLLKSFPDKHQFGVGVDGAGKFFTYVVLTVPEPDKESSK